MDVAAEEKRENTTIIAGPGPQWPTVRFLYVPKCMELVSAEWGAVTIETILGSIEKYTSCHIM